MSDNTKTTAAANAIVANATSNGGAGGHDQRGQGPQDR